MKRAVEEVAEVATAMAEAAQAERGPRILRPNGKRLRPIVAVDAEGKPVKVVTHGDLVQGLVAREGIEIAVQGKRPKWILCEHCKGRVPVGKRGFVPKWHPKCADFAATLRWREKNQERYRAYKNRFQREWARKKKLAEAADAE